MTITTKYSKGDTVYFIYNNSIYQGIISGCAIKCCGESQDEEYQLAEKSPAGNYLPQSTPRSLCVTNLFATKEELIAAITCP